MSFFGKNIKKIRSVKGLSQQAFADLFDLKRGTLGAYEEERSEPKIDTIIKIANYFSIQIDELLTSELSVNKLLKFNGDLTTYAVDVKQEQFPLVPCITEGFIGDYIDLCTNGNFIKELPTLQLPVNLSKEFRGYVVCNLEMTTHDNGFYPKDIVIGEKVPNEIIKKLNNGTLVFVVVQNKLIFKRIFVTKNNAVFRADHKNIEDEEYPVSDIKELWRVRYVFCRRIPEFINDFEDRILMIEQELLRIKEQSK